MEHKRTIGRNTMLNLSVSTDLDRLKGTGKKVSFALQKSNKQEIVSIITEKHMEMECRSMRQKEQDKLHNNKKATRKCSSTI